MRGIQPGTISKIDDNHAKTFTGLSSPDEPHHFNLRALAKDRLFPLCLAHDVTIQLNGDT